MCLQSEAGVVGLWCKPLHRNRFHPKCQDVTTFDWIRQQPLYKSPTPRHRSQETRDTKKLNELQNDCSNCQTLDPYRTPFTPGIEMCVWKSDHKWSTLRIHLKLIRDFKCFWNSMLNSQVSIWSHIPFYQQICRCRYCSSCIDGKKKDPTNAHTLKKRL